MSNLKDEIAAFDAQKKKRLSSEILNLLNEDTTALKAAGIEAKAIQSGDTAPDLTLTNHVDEKRSLAGILRESEQVVSFYRGGW